ncbi:hypothetical protein [Psychromonas sp.]|uniref:hypothetical protein n=1 Tax=Psychromonas sp. TaxID=1884585 RepID=UPI0039E6405E
MFKISYGKIDKLRNISHGVENKRVALAALFSGGLKRTNLQPHCNSRVFTRNRELFSLSASIFLLTGSNFLMK